MVDESNTQDDSNKHMAAKTKWEISVGLILIIFLGAVAVFYINLPIGTDQPVNDSGNQEKQTSVDLTEPENLYNNKEYQKSINKLKSIETKHPNAPGVHMWKGWNYQKLGKYAKAEESFKKLLELKEGDKAAHEGLGWTYYEQNKFEKAIQSFNKAKGPESDAELYKGLGLSHFQLNHYDKTIENIEKAKDMGLKDVEVNYPIGYANLNKYYMTGNERYVNSAKNTLQICSKQEIRVQDECQILLAHTYIDLGENEKASDLLDKESPLSEDDPKFLTAKGRLHFYLQENEKAEEYFQKAINTNKPNRFQIINYNSLGWVNIRNENYKASKDFFEKALKYAENNLPGSIPFTCHTHVGLSITEQNLNNTKRAEELLNTAKELYGNCSALHYYSEFT